MLLMWAWEVGAKFSERVDGVGGEKKKNVESFYVNAAPADISSEHFGMFVLMLQKFFQTWFTSLRTAMQRERKLRKMFLIIQEDCLLLSSASTVWIVE